MKKKKYTQTDIKNFIGKGRTHYIKFQLKNDISIRYHFIWQENQRFENKWIIKDHQNSLKETISSELALRMIEDLCVTPPVEIIGKLNKLNNKYEKILIKPNGKTKLLNDKDLEKKHQNRIFKKHWNITKSKDKNTENKIERIIGNWKYIITINPKKTEEQTLSETKGKLFILKIEKLNTKLIENIGIFSYNDLKTKLNEYISKYEDIFICSEKKLIQHLK